MALALTGIPPFAPTTAKFKSSPSVIAGAAGMRRFRAITRSRHRYEAMSVNAAAVDSER
jgi:hypothetical protein